MHILPVIKAVLRNYNPEAAEENMLSFARQVLIEDGQQFEPVFQLFVDTAELPDGEVEVLTMFLGALFDNEKGKDIAAATMSRATDMFDPDITIFASEAWVAEVPRELSPLDAANWTQQYQRWLKEHGSLENFPGREECLQLVIRSLGEKARVAAYTMVRDENGRVVSLDKRHSLGSDVTISGRFADTMKERKEKFDA